jgi:hypothetical protein
MSRAFRLLLALPAVAAGLSGCVRGTTQTSGPAPVASARLIAPNVRVPTLGPTRAAAGATGSPAANPAGLPSISSTGLPQILAIHLTPTVVSGGVTVYADVHTTPEVVAVTAIAGGVSLPVPRVATGEFAVSTTLPPLPPFAHGQYAVTFRAHDARGHMTQAAANVTVR